jgi:CHASE2 domain-containing sensor protein
MSGRNEAARVFVILGSVVLFASAALHCFAGYSKVFQALTTSNLNPGLQAAFRVVFLSLGWHWLLTAIVALLAGVTETRLRKMLVLLCGLAVLLEAGVGASMMGFFIGNEMIGAAALLLVCGGLLSNQSGART